MKRGAWHRILSAFLTFVLVVGLSPATALAVDELAGGGGSPEEAPVDVLVADEAIGQVADQDSDQVVEPDQESQPEESVPVDEPAVAEATQDALVDQVAENEVAEPVLPAQETPEATEEPEFELQAAMAIADMWLEQYSFAATGGPVDIGEPYVVDENDEQVPASGYDLLYFSVDWDYDTGDPIYTPMNTVPSDMGYYAVAAKGKGAYTGETENRNSGSLLLTTWLRLSLM